MVTDRTPAGPTLAELRQQRQAALVCGAKAPPNGGEPGPTCNRVTDHDGPHRVYRARDFYVLAEWNHDAYRITPRT